MKNPVRAAQKQHVATVEEVERLLPPHVVFCATDLARDKGLETVWFVDEETNSIERGYMMQTELSLYFTFEVIRVSPEEALAGFEVLATSDWMPCDV